MILLKSLLVENNTNIERIGFDPDKESPDMPVDWDAKDIQVCAKWDINTVRAFAGKSKRFAAIYPAIIEVDDLYPHLAEDDLEDGDEYGGGYDWDEFRMRRRGFPPIVVRRTERGDIEIMDGNHRTTWAQNSNYKTIAAWVVDEFLQKVIDSKKKKKLGEITKRLPIVNRGFWGGN